MRGTPGEEGTLGRMGPPGTKVNTITIFIIVLQVRS